MSSAFPGTNGRDPIMIPAEGFVIHFHAGNAVNTTKFGFCLTAVAPLNPKVPLALIFSQTQT